MKSILALLILSVLISACGGGGDSSPQSPIATPTATTAVAPTTAQSAVTPAPVTVSATVEPTLFHGVNVPFEERGYALGALRLSEQSFATLAEQQCVGTTAFAQDDVTGNIEIVCYENGRHLRYSTQTRELTVATPLPRGLTYAPTVACTAGICVYGRGHQNFPSHLPSDAELVLMQNGTVVSRPPMPDQNDNRAVFKLGVEGPGMVVAVSRDFNQTEIAIHRFDVAGKAFRSNCRIHRLEMVDAVVAGKSVFFSLRRLVGSDGTDVLEVDNVTCAVKGRFRLPIDTEGLPLAQFITVAGGHLYVGGGALTQTGVWKFDLATKAVVGFLPTNALPTAGVAAKKSPKLYFATKAGWVYEVDTSTMTVSREVARDKIGDMFLAE